MIILISGIAVIVVGLVFCLVTCCILKNIHRLCQSNSNHGALKVEAAMENDGRRLSECSGASEPLMDVEHPDPLLNKNP